MNAPLAGGNLEHYREGEAMSKRMVVHKDRRLTLPREFSEREGLSPGQSVELKDIELKKRGFTRRAILRYLLLGSLGLDIVARVADTEGGIQFLQRVKIYDPEADQKLLQRLFWAPDVRSGALVPAGNHPFKDPPLGAPWYPPEGECCAAYFKRFLERAVLRTVTGCPRIRPDDNVVLFGSQVSNLVTRQYFGQPWRGEPLFEITEPVRDPGWHASLRWNLHIPEDAPIIERQQFGAPWRTWNHRIAGSKGDKHQSIVRGEGLEDDYLLITSLPRFRSGMQRVIVFAGAHSPGQLATTRLLGAPPERDLRELEKQIAGEPYYQALFHVSVERDQQGESHPKNVALIEASKIDVTFG